MHKHKVGKAWIVLVVASVAIWTAWETISLSYAQQYRSWSSRRGAVPNDVAESAATTEERLREGTTFVDQLGTFKPAGDRVVFQPDGQSKPLIVLENLALERVWRMLDNTRGRKWRVSGTVTEFRTRNFLLLRKAVLKSRSNTTG